MKTWHGNFITTRVFKKAKSLGYDKYNISYSDEKTENGIPKQLELLVDNKFYTYNLITNLNNQQYNAVVAQNKSLQGELAIYKKANKIMAEKINEGNNGDCTYFDKDNNEVSVLEFYYKYALQELEAEND